MRMPIVLEQSMIAEIGRIGEQRKPAEACGVILPTPYRGRTVWEMPNRSHTSHDSFEMRSDDILLQLEGWIQENRDLANWENLVFWHTHPSGGVGPSKTDIENRIPQCGNLVVSLTDNGPVPAWF